VLFHSKKDLTPGVVDRVLVQLEKGARCDSALGNGSMKQAPALGGQDMVEDTHGTGTFPEYSHLSKKKKKIYIFPLKIVSL
jgi:hypothetical protein